MTVIEYGQHVKTEPMKKKPMKVADLQPYVKTLDLHKTRQFREKRIRDMKHAISQKKINKVINRGEGKRNHNRPCKIRQEGIKFQNKNIIPVVKIDELMNESNKSST